MKNLKQTECKRNREEKEIRESEKRRRERKKIERGKERDRK